MIIKNNSYSLMNWVFEGEAVSLKIIGFKEIKNKDF